MTEIIPSILTKTSEEFFQMVKKVEPYVERVHLDIADGIFVPNKTISGYEEMLKLDGSLRFDVHLMVARPEDQMYQWYKTGADRFLIHVETDHGHQNLIEQIHNNGRQVGLVLNPETNIEKISEFIDKIDLVQFMTVHPGFYGGEFVETVLNKILEFHGKYPEMPIAVDGAIHPEATHLETERKAIAAGASILVLGSHIFSENLDVGKAIAELQEAVWNY